MKKLIIILLLLISETGFAQWVQQYYLPGVDFYDMDFINNKTGWACGSGGTIVKTTNVGKTWIQQTTNVPDKRLLGIHALNENVVYCAGYFETILKTTNGGENWIILENGTVGEGNSYVATYFVNENTGWISAFQGVIKKTTNGGKSFFNQVLNLIPDDLYFKDSLNGIGCSGASTIARTSNGGVNWIVDQYFTQTLGSGDFSSLSFINEFTGFIAASNRMVYKTTNYGANWDSIGFVNNSLEPYCVKFINDTLGYCAGSGGEIFRSKDGGKTWLRQTNQINGYIYDITGFDDSLWVCASLGKIGFTSNGGVNINNISSEIPDAFDLHQNYPNPFNAQTNIEFEIRDKNTYSFSVYDIMGKEVYSEKNKFLAEGKYKIDLNLEGLSSGIYFYKLYSPKISLTKNMIMIK